MPQIFHPSMNTVSRVSIFGAVFILLAVVALGGILARSPYVTDVGVVRVQPVPFSHQHHVGDAGIDCRYCHQTVETSAFAGMPSTDVCLDCHSQLWTESPMLAPVWESYRSGRPLAWSRVHDVPDFAYFHHGIHVQKGVGCVECHGRVDRMPLMYRVETLHMEWCLECHRNPEGRLRPQWAVTLMDWNPQENTEAAGAAGATEAPETPETLAPDADSGAAATGASLRQAYNIESETDCSTCHR